MADNVMIGPDLVVKGEGSVTPPPGMTLEDMERLAREADERRRAQKE